MSTALELAPTPTPETLEAVLLGGDLGRLTPAERLSYYASVCRSLGLNPLTKPLEYITLEGKLRLYVRKDATEQLRRLHGVSIVELTSQQIGDVFVVTAKAQNRDGRTDVATGAVATGQLRGDALGNALMKAETKAKRRVTLSICGLGILDESEVEGIKGAVPLDVDPVTGEIREAPAPPPGTISDADRRRLFAIAKKHGWSSEKLKAWLFGKYRLKSTKDLSSTDYDAVVADLESEASALTPKAQPADVDTPF